MTRAYSIFISTTLLLIGVLAIAGLTGWTELEKPPRQGEALDSAAWTEDGRAVHAEAAAKRVVREPQNTWTNLAFVAAGALLIGHCRLKLSQLAGAALVAVGIGSFLYHASASRVFRNFDVGAMYALFFILSLLAAGSLLNKLHPQREKNTPWLAVGAAVFGILATWNRNVLLFGFKPLGLTVVTAVAATFFITALLWMTWKSRSPRTAGATAVILAVFALAVAGQLGDRPGGWWCDPSHVVQGHAVWHVGAAIAVGLGVRMIDRESPAESPGGNQC